MWTQEGIRQDFNIYVGGFTVSFKYPTNLNRSIDGKIEIENMSIDGITELINGQQELIQHLSTLTDNMATLIQEQQNTTNEVTNLIQRLDSPLDVNVLSDGNGDDPPVE